MRFGECVSPSFCACPILAIETERNMSHSENHGHQEGKQLAPQYETDQNVCKNVHISFPSCGVLILLLWCVMNQAQLSLFGFSQPFILLTTDS